MYELIVYFVSVFLCVAASTSVLVGWYWASRRGNLKLKYSVHMLASIGNICKPISIQIHQTINAAGPISRRDTYAGVRISGMDGLMKPRCME
jgi:hypothetical protein